MNEKLHPAYIAGFFDGEGSVWLSKSGAINYGLKVSISQSDNQILEKIKGQYGGRVTTWKSKVNGKRISKWEIANGLVAINFLQEIYPYLVVKKIQCEFAFHFWNLPWRDTSGKRGGAKIKVSQEDKEIDEMFAYSIKIAKPRHWEDYTDINTDEELVDFIFSKVCETFK